MSCKNIFVLLTLIKLCIQLVPVWNFNQNSVSFFSPESPNYREIEVYNYHDYKLKNMYTKNADGTITVTHKLTIYGNEKMVDFGNMQVFEYVTDYGQIICPSGKFHPLDSGGNQITLSLQNPNLDWNLKCVGHATGCFLAYYLNKDHQSLYEYPCENRKWDGGNEYHNMMYDLKVKNDHIANDHYPIIYLALDGSWIKLIGAEQALKQGKKADHTNVETKSLMEVKSKTYGYFNDYDDQFFLITFGNDKYSIAYSLKTDIGSYHINDNIKNVGETVKADLTLPFADKIEIVNMNFINKTPYIYYTVKNLATGKYNYGIMDFLNQKILFNTDQEITNFEPLSNYEMLIFSPSGAHKICLFRDGDNCVSSCPSGTSLVLDVTGNKCKNSGSSTCSSLKLVPDNICIESCDENI